MNPENRGEHIHLRHSHLWRNPLSYEKPVPDSGSCHKQLNERTPFPIQSEPADKVGRLATTRSFHTPMDSEIGHLSPAGIPPTSLNNS